MNASARCWWCDEEPSARRQLRQDTRTGATFHRSCLAAHDRENGLSKAPAKPDKAPSQSTPHTEQTNIRFISTTR